MGFFRLWSWWISQRSEQLAHQHWTSTAPLPPRLSAVIPSATLTCISKVSAKFFCSPKMVPKKLCFYFQFASDSKSKGSCAVVIAPLLFGTAGGPGSSLRKDHRLGFKKHSCILSKPDQEYTTIHHKVQTYQKIIKPLPSESFVVVWKDQRFFLKLSSRSFFIQRNLS